MNRKEWIEYFEAINNRKPTIQELSLIHISNFSSS